ncbi:hypothetical protein PVK06_003953 [Gossypium arboreum]|uniref:Uncharacterized protein n=1 Tax=Gossypium arboreum TaxID=29729 RepID=A0ABR0QQP5_GOSAR|nr:hypothetical protein PVK06_003953 [Gossypium arboreum]
MVLNPFGFDFDNGGGPSGTAIVGNQCCDAWKGQCSGAWWLKGGQKSGGVAAELWWLGLGWLLKKIKDSWLGFSLFRAWLMVA